MDSAARLISSRQRNNCIGELLLIQYEVFSYNDTFSSAEYEYYEYDYYDYGDDYHDYDHDHYDSWLSNSTEAQNQGYRKKRLAKRSTEEEYENDSGENEEDIDPKEGLIKSAEGLYRINSASSE